MSDVEDAWTLPPDRVEVLESTMRVRLQQARDDVGAMHVLGIIAARRESYSEAERLLEEALLLNPHDARIRFDLTRVLYAQRKGAQMLPLLIQLTEEAPADARYRAMLAAALSLTGQGVRAEGILSELLEQHPGSTDLLHLYGDTLRAIGRSEDSIRAYRRCIELNVLDADAWWSLADMKTFRFSAAEVATLREVVGSPELSDDARARLCFALGKALEDQCEFAGSFAHYARANALRRRQIHYDSERFTSLIRRACELYTRDFFHARAGWGSVARDPIFIVGVPRSGSTLVEQILASHSQVEGTGEQPDIIGFAVELWLEADRTGGASYPQPVGALSPAQVDAFAARYLSRTRSVRVLGRPRFVDRMLPNFVHLGLIHLLFPRAAIIDVRRHPMACGFSCYRQLFGRGANFAYDLRELGRYYRDYVTLMTHFDAVLPGRVHRVRYESIVANPSWEIERLLAYCGLPVEEQCLHFHATDRAIHSISSEQVRRPLYRDAVAHWKRYEPWLAPLKEELAELALEDCDGAIETQ